MADEPVLTAGDLGAFDSGTSLSCIVDVDNKKFLYYLDGTLSYCSWRNSIGLAIYNKESGKYENIVKHLC